MDRDVIIKYVSIALAAVALIFSIVSAVNITTVKNSISFDTSVDVAVAGEEGGQEEALPVETAETEGTETADTEETAVSETEASEEEEETEGTAVGGGTMNIILSDGSLKLLDSYVRVPKEGADGTSEDLCVYLEGENTVKYDSQSDYLVVNDSLIIKAIDAADVTYNGISEFTGSNGTPILIGERKVNDTSGIAVVYNLNGAGSSDEAVQEVQDILNNTTSRLLIENLTLFGVSANPDWAQDIVMTENAVELIRGDDSIYITPYTGTFADGATSTLNVGSISLTYSSTIMDDSTGYIPYIYTFSADQGGLVSSSSKSDLMAKFIAQGDLYIRQLFEF